jgi:hypothetical protein
MFAASSRRNMASTRAGGTIPMSMRSPTVLTPLHDSRRNISFGARSSFRRMARTTRTTGTACRSMGVADSASRSVSATPLGGCDDASAGLGA